jgi:hypothetical protein
MFELLNERSPFLPFLKGLSAMLTVTTITIAAAQLATPEPPAMRLPSIRTVSVHLSLRPNALRPHARLAAQAKASRLPTNRLLASVTSAEWRHAVANGHDVDYAVTALDSLPVLQSFGVILAFDTNVPRGTTYLLDLATGSCWVGPVPNDRVVRELEGFTTAEIETARRRVEMELGQPVRVFALYPPELYLALRGYADQAVRRTGMNPASVRAVTVRLRLIRPREFTVALDR